MSLRARAEDGIERTREDALAWARDIVAKGIRVIRLRSGKTRRSERPVALVAHAEPR